LGSLAFLQGFSYICVSGVQTYYIIWPDLVRFTARELLMMAISFYV
jgi:hypothetical protein